SGMGLAANGEGVFATDAMSVAIQAFDLDPAREMPVARFDLQAPPYIWPLDLDIGPDGKVWALDAMESRVHVIDPTIGLVLRSFSLRSRGDRISVAPDGTVFVLQLDGSVAAVKPDGRMESTWRVPPVAGAGVARPEDLAAGPDGRLYVLDAATHSIEVFDPEPLGATATPGPTPGAPCTARGDKSASPQRVTMADVVTVTLTLGVACQGDTGTQADIVLILDRSSSMAGAGCSKLCEAQSAAKSFVADLDLARHRVAVVSFSEVATLDLGLTDDRGAVDAAIDAILPAGNTSIAGALELAASHVATMGRAGALPVFLLLTDGEPSGSEQSFVESVREALRAREQGGLVYTIGLGANVNADLLTAMAGSAERYFFAPGPADLAPIYARLSVSIGGIVASGLVVDDAMGPDVSYVPGTASGSPVVQGNNLTWDFGLVPSEGITVTYRVRPGRVGRLPTNTRAEARYEVAGEMYTFPFPVPVIEVVDIATATPTATAAPPTPTVSAPRPGVAYLPLTMNGVCVAKDRLRGTDIVLVVDTSSSMKGDKLDTALAAGQAFIDAVDPRRDRVGVVAFDSSPRLVYVISAELTAVRRALAGLTTGVGTRVDLGLEAALRELGYRGRPDSPAVFVVLSDGRPTGGTEAAALAAAGEARGRGVTVFAIGLGADVDAAFLRAIAARADHYLFAPEAADLVGLYREVASRLPCR
ncbi:MAG: VWA domain-containing protein, partial [Anaerolineae bacterium]